MTDSDRVALALRLLDGRYMERVALGAVRMAGALERQRRERAEHPIPGVQMGCKTPRIQTDTDGQVRTDSDFSERTPNRLCGNVFRSEDDG